MNMLNKMEKQRPKIGIGVYILNNKNQALLMLRKGKNAPGTQAPPGGHLEMAEELLHCVKRETLEEVNLVVQDAKLWAVNNNITSPTWHYVNLDYLVTSWSGEAKNMELEKCEKIDWFDLNNLPKPLMLPTKNFFENNPLCLCRNGKKFLDCHGK